MTSTENGTTVRRTAVVGSASGLHARPAALVVQFANATTVELRLRKDDREAQPRSIISLLALGASQGDEVEIEGTGEGAEEVVAELAELIASDLDAS